jgi:hypothetical protein
MATLRDPVKAEPVAKYEAFVEEKLAQARGRIRMLDLGAGLLGLLAGTMIFALVMGWLDRWLQFSLGVRQFALAAYGLAAVIYLIAAIIWPMVRRLNPYYAARQVEQTLPSAKNSVINWLDLRREPMPTAIRGAVSHRAAKDMAQANLEEAISDRQTLSLGVVTLILFLLTVAFMFFGPGLGRIFQPFGAMAATPEIRILKPEGGNGSVAEGRAVSVEAEVLGRQSEALRFLYRHHLTDPYEERPMERGDSSHDWVITVPAFEVHNGFWYKVVGTEAETDEYHVEVRSAPAFTEFEVTYHPRPYLRLSDEIVKTHQPDLKGIRGTDISVLARTNRRIRTEDSGLIVAGQQEAIKAEPVPDDSQAMRFHLVLDKDGTYGIQFTSVDRERNNPIFYNITVLPDKAPEVLLTKPEEDKISLPINGVLQVEGSATDDHGVTGFTLRMQVVNKDQPSEPLQSKPYLPGKGFQLADGSYPLALDYADVVELEKLVQTNLRPLQPGMVIEYWLEATDNCDYPAPNVGRSKSKLLTIAAPAADPELEEKKAQAQKEKEKKQAAQDQKLQEQNQAKPEEAPPQEKPPAEQKPAEEKPAEQKPADQKPAEEKPAQEKQAQEEKSPAEQHPAEEKKFHEIEKKLQEQLQQAKQKNPNGSNSDGQKDQDQGMGDQSPMGDSKDGKKDGKPQPKPDDSQGNKDKQKNKQPEKKDGESEPKPNDGQGNDNHQQPQKPDPQQQGKEGQPNKDGPKGKQDGQPHAGQKKQEKPEDSKGNPQKKEQDKGPGAGAKPADKKSGDEPGQANANSPPKPGMNDKAPPKDGQNDQPGQEKPTDNPGKKPATEKGEQGDKKGAEKGESPKNDSPDKKSDADQGKPGDQKPGEKSGDPKDSPSSEVAKKIGDLLKQMKEGNAKEQEQARKELEGMCENCKNPGDRQAAKEALKKAGGKSPGQGSKPGDKPSGDQNKQSGDSQDSKPADKPGDKPGDKSGDQKGSKPGDMKADGDKKGQPGDPDKKQPPQAGDKKPGEGGKPGDGSSDAKNENKSNDSGKGKGEQGESKGSKGEKSSSESPGKPGSNSGGTPQGNREGVSADGGGPEAAKAAEANPEFQKKAGALQLEDYRKKITPDMLEKAKISKQEYDDFLKAYKEKLDRESAEKKTPDKLPDPRRQGGSHSNRPSRQLQSTDKKEDKLPHAGKAEAPPGFSEAYKEFTTETAKSRTAPEKRK